MSRIGGRRGKGQHRCALTFRWPSRRLRDPGVALLLLAAFAAVLVGCGGSNGTQSTSTSIARPPGVNFAVASKIKSGVPRAELLRQLGDPVLTSKPQKGTPGGCLFFQMDQRPLGDVWMFCFDQHNKVSAGATLYSLGEPAPPQGVSAARAVLIARGDSICSLSGQQTGPPEQLVHQIKQVTTRSAPAERRKLAALMRKFSASAEKTRAQLEGFNAPPDQLSELNAYEAALHDQSAAIARAAKALAARDAKSYHEQLQRAKNLGDEATAHARQYGFVTCAGIKLS